MVQLYLRKPQRLPQGIETHQP
jgi:hypothetical protein